MSGRTFRTPAEVSDLLGVSVGTLARWRVEGGGPAHFKIGRAVRYYARDLDEWIARNRGK